MTRPRILTERLVAGAETWTFEVFFGNYEFNGNGWRFMPGEGMMDGLKSALGQHGVLKRECDAFGCALVHPDAVSSRPCEEDIKRQWRHSVAKVIAYRIDRMRNQVFLTLKTKNRPFVEKIMRGDIRYVSPGVCPRDEIYEDMGTMRWRSVYTWRFLHIAFVDDPAYGRHLATVEPPEAASPGRATASISRDDIGAIQDVKLKPSDDPNICALRLALTARNTKENFQEGRQKRVPKGSSGGGQFGEGGGEAEERKEEKKGDAEGNDPERFKDIKGVEHRKPDSSYNAKPRLMEGWGDTNTDIYLVNGMYVHTVNEQSAKVHMRGAAKAVFGKDKFEDWVKSNWEGVLKHRAPILKMVNEVLGQLDLKFTQHGEKAEEGPINIHTEMDHRHFGSSGVYFHKHNLLYLSSIGSAILSSQTGQSSDSYVRTMRNTLRHELAHAMWDRYPEEKRTEFLLEVKDIGPISNYHKSYIDDVEEMFQYKPAEGVKRSSKEYRDWQKEYDSRLNILANETHSILMEPLGGSDDWYWSDLNPEWQKEGSDEVRKVAKGNRKLAMEAYERIFGEYGLARSFRALKASLTDVGGGRASYTKWITRDGTSTRDEADAEIRVDITMDGADVERSVFTPLWGDRLTARSRGDGPTAGDLVTTWVVDDDGTVRKTTPRMAATAAVLRLSLMARNTKENFEEGKQNRVPKGSSAGGQFGDGKGDKSEDSESKDGEWDEHGRWTGEDPKAPDNQWPTSHTPPKPKENQEVTESRNGDGWHIKEWNEKTGGYHNNVGFVNRATPSTYYDSRFKSLDDAVRVVQPATLYDDSSMGDGNEPVDDEEDHAFRRDFNNGTAIEYIMTPTGIESMLDGGLNDKSKKELHANDNAQLKQVIKLHDAAVKAGSDLMQSLDFAIPDLKVFFRLEDRMVGSDAVAYFSPMMGTINVSMPFLAYTAVSNGVTSPESLVTTIGRLVRANIRHELAHALWRQYPSSLRHGFAAEAGELYKEVGPMNRYHEFIASSAQSPKGTKFEEWPRDELDALLANETHSIFLQGEGADPDWYWSKDNPSASTDTPGDYTKARKVHERYRRLYKKWFGKYGLGETYRRAGPLKASASRTLTYTRLITMDGLPTADSSEAVFEEEITLKGSDIVGAVTRVIGSERLTARNTKENYDESRQNRVPRGSSAGGQFGQGAPAKGTGEKAKKAKKKAEKEPKKGPKKADRGAEPEEDTSKHDRPDVLSKKRDVRSAASIEGTRETWHDIGDGVKFDDVATRWLSIVEDSLDGKEMEDAEFDLIQEIADYNDRWRGEAERQRGEWFRPKGKRGKMWYTATADRKRTANGFKTEVDGRPMAVPGIIAERTYHDPKNDQLMWEITNQVTGERVETTGHPRGDPDWDRKFAAVQNAKKEWEKDGVKYWNKVEGYVVEAARAQGIALPIHRVKFGVNKRDVGRRGGMISVDVDERYEGDPYSSTRREITIDIGNAIRGNIVDGKIDDAAVKRRVVSVWNHEAAHGVFAGLPKTITRLMYKEAATLPMITTYSGAYMAHAISAVDAGGDVWESEHAVNEYHSAYQQIEAWPGGPDAYYAENEFVREYTVGKDGHAAPNFKAGYLSKAEVARMRKGYESARRMFKKYLGPLNVEATLAGANSESLVAAILARSRPTVLVNVPVVEGGRMVGRKVVTLANLDGDPKAEAAMATLRLMSIYAP